MLTLLAIYGCIVFFALSLGYMAKGN